MLLWAHTSWMEKSKICTYITRDKNTLVSVGPWAWRQKKKQFHQHQLACKTCFSDDSPRCERKICDLRMWINPPHSLVLSLSPRSICFSTSECVKKAFHEIPSTIAIWRARKSLLVEASFWGYPRSLFTLLPSSVVSLFIGFSFLSFIALITSPWSRRSNFGLRGIY